jgi:hypothetical protein
MICACSSHSGDYGRMCLLEVMTDSICHTSLARNCRLIPFGGFLNQFVQ